MHAATVNKEIMNLKKNKKGYNMIYMEERGEIMQLYYNLKNERNHKNKYYQFKASLHYATRL